MAGTMSDKIYVQYLGFKSKALVREYTFSVWEIWNQQREFTLTIANEAFVSHRVRYQDAPDICSLKLRHELATYANHPPKTHFPITDAELENYGDAHGHKSKRGQ
jgi:hypothetical protein